MSPEALIPPEISPQGSGGWSLLFVPQATDMLSVLSASRFYWGPYGGVLTIVQGVVFHRLLVPWYFDTRQRGNESTRRKRERM
jgi:hypothetical protein